MSMPARDALTFAWLRGERFSFVLPACVLLSFAVHAGTFFLFQVVYSERVTLAPPAPSIRLLDARRPDHQALWRLIESEDPAPAMSAQTAVPEQLLEFPYRASYSTVRTWPQTLPDAPAAVQFPTARDPIAIIRSANRVHRAPEISTAKIPTRLMFGGDLATRPLQRPLELSFKTRPPKPLAPARFLLGVNAGGEVAFSFLQSSSGDAAVDTAAAAHFPRLAFAPADSPVTWGHVVFLWGDDVYASEALLPEKKIVR